MSEPNLAEPRLNDPSISEDLKNPHKVSVASTNRLKNALLLRKLPGAHKAAFAMPTPGKDDAVVNLPEIVFNKTPEEEKQILKRIFELIDADGSGVIDQEEVISAVQIDKEVIDFVKQSSILQPLVKKKQFKEAFMAMDADNSDGVTFDEFMNFCLGARGKQMIVEEEQKSVKQAADMAKGQTLQ
jgi:hypothetical protein